MSDKAEKLTMKPSELVMLGVIALMLHLSSLYSYLLFHSVVEILRVVVLFGVFVLAWHSRRWSQNSFLTFVGISCVFVGSLELLHALAYKGMGVFEGYDANLATQLWVAFRYLESISLLVAALLIDRRFSPAVVFGSYSLVTTAIAIAIFSGVFPDCFVEGKGLTTFKIASEYVISGLLLASILLLVRNRRSFDREVLTLLVLSLAASAGAEIAFTQYVSVYGPANELGHYLLLLSAYFVYRAVLVTGLVKPFSLLLRNLKQQEEELEIRVADRTTALAHSEERFRVLVEQAPEAIIVIDVELDRIVDANANAEKLFGCGRDELRKHGPQDFYPPGQPDERPVSEAFRDHLKQALAGKTIVFERAIHSAEGKDVLCEVRLSRLPSADRQVIRASFIDISERKRAEEELRKQHQHLEELVATRTAELTRANGDLEAFNRELEAFSYSVSHDLRVPLRAIDGFSRILLEDYSGKLDAEGRRLLNVVRDNADRMARLIDDILAFSRAGRSEIAPMRIDMDGAVRAVLEELQPAIAGRKLTFDIRPLAPANGDAAMIGRVWTNLIDNAIKFTAPRLDAVIEIGSTAGEKETTYYVKDNGAGFDMQYADKLFGAFQRLHGSEFPGTGIGLAIVKRIVTRHGGRVWAEGKMNEGATFYFALPVREVSRDPIPLDGALSPT